MIWIYYYLLFPIYVEATQTRKEVLNGYHMRVSAYNVSDVFHNMATIYFIRNLIKLTVSNRKIARCLQLRIENLKISYKSARLILLNLYKQA